jgi:hypothetical protein
LYLHAQLVRPEPGWPVDHAVAVGAQQRKVVDAALPWSGGMQRHDMVALDETMSTAEHGWVDGDRIRDSLAATC